MSNRKALPQVLPQEIIDPLRRIAAVAGNEKAVDEDPVQILSMLLFAIERHLSVTPSTIVVLRAIVKEYCSPTGIALYSHHLKEKKIA